MTNVLSGMLGRSGAAMPREQIGSGDALPQHDGLTSKVRICAFGNWKRPYASDYRHAKRDCMMDR
jgi:hypothetical protein